MFGKGFELFRVFGIKIRLDLSWFLVFFLIAWSLARSAFPQIAEGLATATYWSMGILGALALFASVVAHELAHALVARSFDIEIRGITLFVFGGVAEMADEPPHPKAELLVALAGPALSLVLGLTLLVGERAVSAATAPAVAAVLFYVGWINLILAVFNMIPAFPLDGGRVLRAVLWQVKQDLRLATRITSSIGSGFGFLLILFGIFRLLAFGDVLGGLWTFLIGMFVRNAAQISYQQLLLRRVLEGEPVARFMKTAPVTVPRHISIAELVESYIYKHHFKSYPVVDDGRLLGFITTRQVKELPREEWNRQTVGSLVQPLDGDNSVSPDTDAMSALAAMSRTGLSRLLVVDGDRLVGILSLKDLLNFFSLKIELESG